MAATATATAATATEVFVGIDVSKARLDVMLLPTRQRLSLGNDAAGIEQLLRALAAPLSVTLVVLEATGRYQRAAAGALLSAGLPVSVVNPGTRR